MQRAILEVQAEVCKTIAPCSSQVRLPHTHTTAPLWRVSAQPQDTDWCASGQMSEALTVEVPLRGTCASLTQKIGR